MAEPVGGRPSRRASQTAHHLPIDADTMRRLQLARGAMTCQMIASRVALQSLQSVDVNDLPDNEKSELAPTSPTAHRHSGANAESPQCVSSATTTLATGAPRA